MKAYSKGDLIDGEKCGSTGKDAKRSAHGSADHQHVGYSKSELAEKHPTYS
jgi:hypothetical protein